jgi:hypothetical protein
MTLDDLIVKLCELRKQYGIGQVEGSTQVFIDNGSNLCEIEDVDLGGSDEGVVIWCGDIIE